MSPQGLAGDRSLTSTALGRVRHPFGVHVLSSSVGAGSSAVHSDSKTLPQHSAPKPRQPTRGSQTLQSHRSVNFEAVWTTVLRKHKARVIRPQVAVDLLEEDNPDAACLKTMVAKAKAQTRVAPVRERLDACLKFIERAKKRLESADQDVIKAQEARAARETELCEGLANLQRLRSEATSAAPVSSSSWSLWCCRCSRGDPKVEGPHFSVGVWIHGHISRGDASEESQDPQCPVTRPRGRGMHAVGQSRRCPSSKGSEHVDVNVDQRGRFGFEERQTTRAVNSLRDARCGLRGARVGEASHLGQPKLTVRLGGGVQLERSAADNACDIGHNVRQRRARKSPLADVCGLLEVGSH